MKNDNEKTKYNPLKAKEFFSQFSKENLSKIVILADVIKGELEITKKYTNEEKERNRSEYNGISGDDELIGPMTYENSDYVLRINFGRVPVNLTPDEFIKLLHKVGGAFRFFDFVAPPYDPYGDYDVGITSKENFDFFYGQFNKYIGRNSQEVIDFIKIKDIHLDVESYLIEINNGEKLIYFKSRKNSKESDKETKRFKVLAVLWESRWELKDNKVVKKGDYLTLDNIKRNTKIVSDDAVRKQIERLNAIFKKEKVPVGIEGQERCRLVVHK